VPICTGCGREIEGDFAFCPYCGTAIGTAKPARELRKTVTVLFCDVAGSTSLGESVDPEALRAILVRYFERISGIVEGHGGTVEKFVGDAVMAVFGVPVLHEDDALRAVRAAAEILEALPEVGVQARIGVNTGEVSPAPRSGLRPATLSTSLRGSRRRRFPGRRCWGPRRRGFCTAPSRSSPCPRSS
jgi:hypothetical protein